ncbi:uncharacterized protein LOC129761346 [Toxorhynchites rutilus septentrionalis]|uniref:uncharacterized protein LOC129761346 n=1 Tax=Toxorhynchites rutilus septentrionalis TaxID=329112 RepID=UPI00247AA867|nr:uncharacterized protein LOC129761346 [Toxorhynchites rutilus septentrionalis]
MKQQVGAIIFGLIVVNVFSWECTKPGRFPDPEDSEGCDNYVTCIPNSGGSFELRTDQCNPGSLFSAKYQRCIVGDSCDELEDFYSIEYDCSECGKFVNVHSHDCRQFVNCLKTKDPGVFVAIKQSCPKAQVFSSKSLSCVNESEYQCPPVALKFLSDFVCLDVGKYPDESVPNCKGYRLCSKLRNGTLVSNNYLCENSFVFSEVEKKCVSHVDYDCPDDSNYSFVCPGIGQYPDAVSKTCETFHNCVENSKGQLESTLSTCLEGDIFSAIASKCVSKLEYVCPRALTELKLLDQYAEDGPINVRPLSSDLEISLCVESGRFSNDEDERCETYNLCSRDAQDNWFKVIVRCPSGTLFSSEKKRCVDNEAFVCSTMTTELLLPSTSDLPTVELNTYECVEGGAIANADDNTCKTYYLCSLNSENILTQALFICPHESLFSTLLNKCVKDDGTFQCHGTTQLAALDNSDVSGDGIDTTVIIQSTVVDSGQIEVPSLTKSDTPSDSQVTILTTTIPASSYTYPCTATGRFADINSEDCGSYFLCKEDKSGSIVSVHLNCPSGMVFSRNNNKCIISDKYLC